MERSVDGSAAKGRKAATSGGFCGNLIHRQGRAVFVKCLCVDDRRTVIRGKDPFGCEQRHRERYRHSERREPA